MKFIWRLACIFVFLCGPAVAHEVRPAYLELQARTDTTFDMMFKLPALGGRPLKVSLVMRVDKRVSALGPTLPPSGVKSAVLGRSWIRRHAFWSGKCSHRSPYLYPGAFPPPEEAVGRSAGLMSVLAAYSLMHYFIKSVI